MEKGRVRGKKKDSWTVVGFTHTPSHVYKRIKGRNTVGLAKELARGKEEGKLEEARGREGGAEENEASRGGTGVAGSKKESRGSFCRKLNDNTWRCSLERFERDKGWLLGRVRNESTGDAAGGARGCKGEREAPLSKGEEGRL